MSQAHHPHPLPLKWLWDLPTAPAAPAPAEAQVWSFSLDEMSTQITQLAGLLSPDERERAEKFGSEELRHRFIGGRATLRKLLARTLNCEARDVRFRYGAKGKPELAGRHEGSLHFNLSHSGNVGLVAITRMGPVGVDVERIRPAWNPQEIASRFFTKNEGKQLESVSEAERSEAFFRLWTRKEAWLKATGEGIATSLDRVEVSFMPNEPARVLNVANEPGEAGQWMLAELAPASGFVGALAVKTRSLNIRCCHWSKEAK